ncbi:MAG: hypothetical protein C6P37_03715 [Caldibacillus debilis]|uniref:Uncharacterized protein n=1 Tax=Caldibacillus debilis TaxID=301148 RepID=A0A3E0K6X2_9BACI|nr:MAG: hypothetical protein C6P37_03715 [Caldibacillus debilis]
MNDRKRRQTARKAARNVWRFSWRPSPALRPPGRWEQESQGLSRLFLPGGNDICQQRFKIPHFQRNEIPHYERLIRQLGRINSCFFFSRRR